MKKVTNISLAGIAFSIEEDAYEVLKAYLAAIETHFASLDDGKEILADIESGIEEKLSAELETPKSAVTLAMIERVIAEMGRVEDIVGDEDAQSTEEKREKKEESTGEKKSSSKRLFRDTENAILGGVAAGIANYLNIDPTFVRLMFVLTMFVNGFGILAYLVLWLIVPAAKTTTEKYQMRGETITLAGIADRVQEEVEHLRTQDISGIRRLWRHISGFLNELFRLLGRLIRLLFNILRYAIGGILMFASTIALLALVTSFLFAALNPTSEYLDFPLATFISGTVYHLALITFFVLAAVPVLFVAILGKILVHGKGVAKHLSLALVGVWMLAIISGALLFDPIYSGYQNAVESEVAYFRVVSSAVSPGPFEAIEVRNGKQVTIVEGEEYAVELTGIEKEVRKVSVTNEDGRLVITNKQDFRICFFCFSTRDKVDVIITTPEPITSVIASNSTSVTAEQAIAVESLTLNAANSSDIMLGDVRVEADVTAEARNSSHIKLVGSAATLDVTARNSSHVDAQGLTVSTTTAEVSNSSHAEVNAENALSGGARNSSSITQHGTVSTEDVTESNSSHVDVKE